MSGYAVASYHEQPPAKLAAALQRAEARIQQLEQENNKLRNEVRWIDRLLAVPASVMSPSHKVTLRAAVKAYQQATPDENGLVQIESWRLCKTVGQSKQTFLDNITYCTEQLGILTKKRERIVDSDTNDYTTNLYIGVTPLLARPHEYKVETPRNHGGERQICPHCHSEQLQRKVTITCMNCGSVLDEKCNPVNQGSHLDVSDETQESASDTNVNLTTNITNIPESQVDDSAIATSQEPATPPVDDVVHDAGLHEIVQQETSPDKDEQHQAHTMSQADVLAQAAKLLVEIAGPEPVHIEMSPRGPKKYYDVRRALTEQAALAHLKGWKTKGAYLRRSDGMTRALCYDADHPQDWECLLDAARSLSEAGYRPIVEDSPAGRGGHLWIIFTSLVYAPSAKYHVLQVAPMLQHIRETWPGSGPNKVRLPGGKYVKPGFAQWCKLHDAHGARLSEDGRSAARVLLDYQTPVEVLPAYPDPEPVESCPEPDPLPGNQDNEASEALQTDHVAGVDQHWQHKYNRYLWFHFTPTQLAAWYNERNQVEGILPPEENGMGLASWRGEHTASVGLREDGWVDFGASARKADGKQDGGDVLELTVRVTDEPKPEVMRGLARQLVQEARDAMESAARNGEQPSQWVQAFMSPAGWERYHQLCEEAGYSDQGIAAACEPTCAGGVAGFHSKSPAQAVPDETPTKDTPEALAAELGAIIGDPCKKCGCTLYYQSGPYQMCHVCLPRPAKFGLLSNEQHARLNALFPRKVQSQW